MKKVQGVKLAGLFLIIFMASIFLNSTMALAATTQDQALLAADNFLDYMGSSKTISASRTLSSNFLDTSKPVIVSGWVMDLSGGGFILIAASQDVSPVKSYSLKSDYDKLPPQYKDYLEQELEFYARVDFEISSGARTSMEVQEKTPAQTAWDFLLTWDPSARRELTYTPDTYLLTTTWGQGYPYNKFLPEIGGQNVVAGCVNTAVAQVMKYHGHPNKGAGKTSYAWNNENLETVLAHPYYWGNMPNAPGIATAAHLQDEVAILIRDLSIVNKTKLTLSQSEAVFLKDDFVRFFGYSNTAAIMNNTNTEFFSTMKNQIDQELPVLLLLPKHMVVADGYVVDQTGRKFHLNMGWNGAHDIYYSLDKTIEIPTNPPITFLTNPPELDIVYNVKPCSGPDCVIPEPPTTDIAPEIFTEFKDIIIPADVAQSHKFRVDARDENGDEITYSTRLSNSDTITANIVNDILTITPLTGSMNKAAKLRITSQAGGKKAEKDFLVMTAGQSVTYGTAQTINGLFEGRAREYLNEHPVILEGNTSILADRGYGNQAFFISVKDSQGNTVVAETTGVDDVSVPAIQHNFPLGRYTITACLTASTGAWWAYTQGQDDEYVLKISSPDANADVEQIAALLGVDMSKITLLPVGTVTVDVTPDTASWMLSGPDAFPGSGQTYTGDKTFTDAVVGTYTWSGQELAGHDTPATGAKTLAEDGTISFNKTWTLTPLTGSVSVDVTPDTASWTLAGPDGFEGNGQTYTGNKAFADVLIGNYTWTGQNLPDYDTPAPETKTLVDNGTTSFNKVFTDLNPDTDGDGVKDNQDRCPGTQAGTIVDASGCTLTKGDLNKDNSVDLEDAFPGLKVTTSQQNSVNISEDVDGDGKIDIKDIIYIIQN